jgi:NADH dehydrogenase [ubiquinone] 1 alpha subcomplex assembly factor 3
MDMLGSTPAPSTSVDICMPDGFALNSGVRITDGDGALLVGGDAFAWRPWREGMSLLNKKGQWDVPAEAFGLLGLVWPRPGTFLLSFPFSPFPLLSFIYVGQEKLTILLGGWGRL